MKQYTVLTTIQSGDKSNPPCDVHWYRGDNLGRAIAAMANAAAHDEEVDHGDLPESMRYRTLSVRLTIEEDA